MKTPILVFVFGVLVVGMSCGVEGMGIGTGCFHQEDPYIPEDRKPTIAVCLSGQVRLMDYVASSLAQNFFGYLGKNSVETHVYISSFLSDSSTGIHLLLKEMLLLQSEVPNVRLARIHMPYQYPNTYPILPKNPRTRDEGTSGLFNLTQTCGDLIIEGERRFLVKYDTIIRTRLDTIWTTTPVNLPLLFPSTPDQEESKKQYIGSPCFHHPKSYGWYGINDRFSIGPRDVILAGIARFKSLKLIQPQESIARYLNSEFSLKFELETRDICQVALVCPSQCPKKCSLPFCVAQSHPIKSQMGGPVFTPRGKRHVHEGGKCYVGNSTDPSETAAAARMNPLYFRALSFPPLTNCSRELLDAILALNTQFTSDGSVDDMCEFVDHYPTSEAFRRVYQTWRPLLKAEAPALKRPLGHNIWGNIWDYITNTTLATKISSLGSPLEDSPQEIFVDDDQDPSPPTLILPPNWRSLMLPLNLTGNLTSKL